MREAHQSPQTQRALGPLLGSGLLLSEGELHARQRRVIAPAFHFARLKEMMPDMVSCTVDVVAAWASGKLVTVVDRETSSRHQSPPHAWSGPVDVHKHLSQLTLRIIGRSAFGVDFGNKDLAQRASTGGLLPRSVLYTAPGSLPNLTACAVSSQQSTRTWQR